MKNFWKLCLILAFSLVFVAAAYAQEQLNYGAPVTIPMITGQVMSVDSSGGKFPLSHESGWLQSIMLSRRDPESGLYSLWANGTDCFSNNQGCADRFGRFRFSQQFDGNRLEPGDYKVTIEGLGHFPRNMYVTLGDVGTQNLGEIRLVLSPVHFFFSTGTEMIPEDGGPITLGGFVCNLDAKAESVQSQILVGGPTKTQLWGNYQVPSLSVPIPGERWTCQAVELSHFVAADLPNGEIYCATFSLGPAEAAFSQVGVCARKVALPSGMAAGSK